MARFLVQTHKEDEYTLPVFEGVDASRYEVNSSGALVFYGYSPNTPTVAYADGMWFTVVPDEDNM